MFDVAARDSHVHELPVVEAMQGGTHLFSPAPLLKHRPTRSEEAKDLRR